MTEVDKIHVFKLSDLVKMYHTSLEELGIHLETRIYSKQLKNRLLSQFQDLSVQNFQKVILGFKFDVAEAISTVAKFDLHDDSYIIARIASIL